MRNSNESTFRGSLQPELAAILAQLKSFPGISVSVEGMSVPQQINAHKRRILGQRLLEAVDTEAALAAIQDAALEECKRHEKTEQNLRQEISRLKGDINRLRSERSRLERERDGLRDVMDDKIPDVKRNARRLHRLVGAMQAFSEAGGKLNNDNVLAALGRLFDPDYKGRLFDEPPAPPSADATAEIAVEGSKEQSGTNVPVLEPVEVGT